MSSIHNETDFMITTECLHRLNIKSTIDTLPMMQGDILLTCLGTVVIDFSSLLQHLHSLATFRCSSEYQYHR